MALTLLARRRRAAGLRFHDAVHRGPPVPCARRLGAATGADGVAAGWRPGTLR